jgi:DNA (cytosine-5)-methyltransferase 1
VSRPVLLDLFCGAGGAAAGYHRAGFDVVGVDIAPQPHYPFEFHQADALTFPLDGFDAIHASPPCQAYSLLRAMHPDREWPDLIPAMRERLQELDMPWVMENVEASPLLHQAGLFGFHGITFCGTSFGLGARGMELRRHRRFESNVPLSAPPCRHRLKTIGVYGHGGHTGKHRMAYAHEAREAMGIDWMNRDEMCEAIPPAYTECIGTRLLEYMAVRA